MMGLDMKDSHVYRRVNESGGVEKLENLDPAVQRLLLGVSGKEL